MISRAETINTLKGLPTWWAGAWAFYGYAKPPVKALLEPEDVISAIENLPSAQPEQKWISCSERLPEEDGLYFVTTSKGQVQVHVFSHDGNSEEYWMRCNKAWMPLPEAYEG